MGYNCAALEWEVDLQIALFPSRAAIGFRGGDFTEFGFSTSDASLMGFENLESLFLGPSDVGLAPA